MTRVRIVDSFNAMCRDDFTGDENALLLPRRLTGWFNVLAMRVPHALLAEQEEFLKTLEGGRGPVSAAARQVLSDIQNLRDNHFTPELRVVNRGRYGPSVHGFHVDVAVCRILCCYNGAATEFLDNQDAVPTDPNRARGTFKPKEGAAAQSFQLGDIWRHKGIRSGQEGDTPDAFIHRAPRMKMFSIPRLLLVGEYQSK